MTIKILGREKKSNLENSIVVLSFFSSIFFFFVAHKSIHILAEESF